MTDQILDRILVNTVFLRHRNKVFPAVVRAMLRVQIQLISYSAKRLLVACVGELYIFAPVPRIEPVKEILAAASWVRAGIISGWLPIGKATRNGKLVTSIEEMNSKYGRINFYISPKLLYQETGFLWKGEKI